VYRPGHAPEHGFELVLPARSSSPHTVAAEVTRDVEKALSGPDGEHATFRGSVEAAFFPLSAGMPPVTGGLAAAVFDVVPLGGELAEARVAEGRRFAEFSGVLFAEGGSLVVDGVMPRSPAERAGVARGDRLSELGGLRVLGRTDLVPPPRARQVELVVHRNGVADPVRLVLETDGFQKLTPRDLAAAGGVLAATLALFASLRSPLGRALSFLELRLVEVLRVRRERRRTRELERGKRRRMPGFLHAVLPTSPAAYLALAAATGVIMFLGMGGAIVAREVDLAVIAAATLASATAAALVFGAPGERGLALRLRRVALVLGQGLPLVGAVACAALETGGVGLDELARAQGALPWQWHAFQNPVLLCAMLVFFAALVPEAARGSTDAVALPGEAKRPMVRAVPELVGWTELVIACGIGAFAFFGGARTQALVLPPDAPLGAALFGAAVVVVKTLALVLSVLCARAVVGRLDLSETRGMTFRVLLPVAVFAALATLALQRAEVRPMAGSVAATLGLSCFVGVALLAATFARRVVAGTSGRDAEPGVNPWI
jgi:NADH:ubiquinone oxidoreductase subunit H